MTVFWGLLGWIWRKKLFFLISFASAAVFFVLLFPFSDLSDVVTNAVARATGNQVYLQFDTLDLHVLPQPAISATEVSVETSLPPLKAKWAKFTPGLLGAAFSLPTVISAIRGDAEAAAALPAKIGASFSAEGLLGGDVHLSLGSGSKSEGRERSRVTMGLSKLSLAEVQKWTELSTKMSGEASLDTDLQLSLDFAEQPEGEYKIVIERFNLPAGTVMMPMGEAQLPVNIPNLTLANVVLRGRLQGGNLLIEEGSFGQAKDPVHGKIKGKMGMRLQAQGANVFPLFGSYELVVDLNTSQIVEKELGFAFIMLGSVKTPTAGGGAHYLFRARGNGIGMAYAPDITRVNSF